jgi:hypothetical protein
MKIARKSPDFNPGWLTIESCEIMFSDDYLKNDPKDYNTEREVGMQQEIIAADQERLSELRRRQALEQEDQHANLDPTDLL